MENIQDLVEALEGVESFGDYFIVFLDLPFLLQIFVLFSGIGLSYVAALIFMNLILSR